MNEKKYLETRLDDQIDWYDAKSQWNQRWFKRMQLTQIVAAATIPFLAGMEAAWTSVVVGALGVIVAVIAATIGLYKFQEHWIQYRTTCESLRHEKYLYLTATEPYDVEEPFPLLVQRVEALISKENTSWGQYLRKAREEGARPEHPARND